MEPYERAYRSTRSYGYDTGQILHVLGLRFAVMMGIYGDTT